MAIVDNTLEVLGIPKRYSEFLRYVKKSVVTWIIISLILKVYHTVWYAVVYGISGWFYLNIICNISVYMNTVNDLNFYIILRCIEDRFRSVNECIRGIIADRARHKCWIQNRFFLCGRNPFIDERNRRIMWIAMHLHLEICKISREINTTFVLKVCLTMISAFAQLATYFCHAYNTFFIYDKYGEHWLLSATFFNIWIFMLSWKAYIINHACERVTKQATATIEIVNEVLEFTEDHGSRRDIMQFFLQTLHRPLKFFGPRFQWFGYVFVQKFFTTLTTVVVLIIQFNPLGGELK